MLASTVAVSPAALAEVTFNSVSGGSIEAVGSRMNAIESVIPGTVRVQATTPANITASPPRLIAGPTPDPARTNRLGVLKVGSTSVRSDVGGGTTSLPVGETTLEIEMRVERPVTFTAGIYIYSVLLTIAPP